MIGWAFHFKQYPTGAAANAQGEVRGGRLAVEHANQTSEQFVKDLAGSMALDGVTGILIIAAPVQLLSGSYRVVLRSLAVDGGVRCCPQTRMAR